jgi:hypothetical protein
VALAEKLDGDLRGHLIQGTPHFLGGVCQSVRVDVDSNAASTAAHVSAQLETSDRLLKLMPALRALEFDQMRVAHGAEQNNADLATSAKSMIGTTLVGASQKAICHLRVFPPLISFHQCADQTHRNEATSTACSCAIMM